MQGPKDPFFFAFVSRKEGSPLFKKQTNKQTMQKKNAKINKEPIDT